MSLFSPWPTKKLTKKEFPRRLREIPDAPEELFVKGNLPDERSTRLLTVVGSRKFSTYGRDACREIVGGLAPYPITIVSGLAIGIDTLAHQAALEAGLKTIAVPGSGLGEAVLYPRINLKLARKILAAGGSLASEFPDDTRAQKYSFPRRNRIMAGLSEGVLIVEAQKKSGTLITAHLALDYNRLVFAVPGSIFSGKSEGTNTLIKEGAIPVTTAEDILAAFGIEPSPESKTFAEVSDDERMLLSALGDEELAHDELTRKLAWPTPKVNTLLTSLELKGIVVNARGAVRSAARPR